ncbi:MAG: DUF3021 family protein [Clostridia bacterium]|nr:DUF3021 family protein [Clostridia bacterium]
MLKKIFSFKRIMYYIIICCVSYTACSLILTTVNMFGDAFNSLPLYVNLQYFAVCLLISFLMFFTDQFTDGCTKPLAMLIQITDVSVVVFGLGGFVFGWFPLDAKWILPVFLILLSVYFATYIVLYFIEKKWINDVNIILKQRKKEKNDDEKNN